NRRTEGDLPGGEIAGTGGRGRHRSNRGIGQCLPQALIVDEEECLVALNWSAGGRSELIAAKGWFWPVEEVARVAFVFAHKFIHIAGSCIGAGARSRVDDTAGRTAVGCVVVVREHGKFLNRIGAERQPQRTAGHAVRVVVEADSVEKIVVL